MIERWGSRKVGGIWTGLYIAAMKRRSRKTFDKYSVAGRAEAEYVDAASTVLVNKLGATDLRRLQLAEEQSLAKAYESLAAQVRVDTPISCDLLKEIHLRIFGDIYEWAGRWRTVQISKPGAIWPAAQYLEDSMRSFEKEFLASVDVTSLHADDDFAKAVGALQGEFLAIHPFREGNARTIKLASDLIALQTGRPPLIYDSTTDGTRRYIEAASAALCAKAYALMTDVIREALSRAREARP